MHQIYGFCPRHNQHYVRIRKNDARRRILTDPNAQIFMMPCNFRPSNMWLDRGADLRYAMSNNGCTFNEAVNAFEYYNCVDSETGRYAAFYLWFE